jgi:hypothetical protein
MLGYKGNRGYSDFQRGWWRFILCWYDLWIGAFFDRKKRKLYIFPVPMVGVEVQLPIGKRCVNRMSMTPWGYMAQCDLVEGHEGFHVYEGESRETQYSSEERQRDY